MIQDDLQMSAEALRRSKIILVEQLLTMFSIGKNHA